MTRVYIFLSARKVKLHWDFDFGSVAKGFDLEREINLHRIAILVYAMRSPLEWLN